MVLFVIDASPALGFGHLTRCLNLARLNRHRFEIKFLFKKNKTAAAILQMNRFPFTSEFNPDKWPSQPELLVFDICRMDPEYTGLLEKLKEHALPVLQITDLGLNILPATTIVDGSLHQYTSLLENLFFGPEYMILHHKFRHFNTAKRHYRNHITHVFISLGGSAPYRLLRRTIDMFSRHRYSCKVAPGFLLKKNQKKILSRLYPTISWVGHTESLARAMYQSDLAVISPGVTAYEAAATGTPALYLSHHSLQARTASLFEEQQVGIGLGLTSQFNEKHLLQLLESLTCKTRSEMGDRGKNLIDGLGLYRVNNIINTTLIPNGEKVRGGQT